MKKTFFAVCFGIGAALLLVLSKSHTLHAHAITSFQTNVEEVTQSTAGTALGTHIDPNDGCIYYKVGFIVSGNTTTVGGGGVAITINGDYFEAVCYSIPGNDPKPYIENASGLGFATSYNSQSDPIVAFAFAEGYNGFDEPEGALIYFLIKTKANITWTNQDTIVKRTEVSNWIDPLNHDISYSAPQSYTYQITRIIGDLNGDGETDVQDVQLLNAALYDGFLNIPYTDEVSSYSAHITIFSNCTNMIVTVAGTTYVILGMADADQNNYINSGDASAFLQYYTDSLAHLDTGDYIGCPYTFYIEIPYTA